MGGKKDFSSSSPRKIASLTYQECVKHALDAEDGVSFKWMRHILSDCKKVIMIEPMATIKGSLKKAVYHKKLFFVNGKYQVPDQKRLYAERRMKIESLRLERERLSKKKLAAHSSKKPVPSSLDESNLPMTSNKKSELKKKRREKMKKQRDDVKNKVTMPKGQAKDFKKDSNTFRHKSSKKK